MSHQNKPGLRSRKKKADPEAIDLAAIEERRADLRRPTFKAGEVRFEGRSVPCIVRNVSEHGCLLKFEQASAIPDIVEIRIDLDKPARLAEIIWRSTTLAGAMFFRNPS